MMNTNFKLFRLISVVGAIATLLVACSKDPAVTGRVVDIYGNPIADATVRIDSTSLSAKTDSQGNYEIAYVPGNFVLVFEKALYGPYKLPMSVTEKTMIPAQAVTLKPRPEGPGVYAINPQGGNLIPLTPTQVEKSTFQPGRRFDRVLTLTGNFPDKIVKVPLPKGEALYFAVSSLGNLGLYLYASPTSIDIANLKLLPQLMPIQQMIGPKQITNPLAICYTGPIRGLDPKDHCLWSGELDIHRSKDDSTTSTRIFKINASELKKLLSLSPSMTHTFTFTNRWTSQFHLDDGHSFSFQVE